MSPTWFPLAHMAKQNGRHLSLLTLTLEPLGMSPLAHMAKQNGRHFPTYPHT
jgi:hypothetical protein